MSDDRTIQIKNYITSHFAEEDEALSAIHQSSKKLGLPNIHVPSNVGKLLYCLAKIRRPHRILEIGTLGGYSTVWLAKALPPGGKVISIECFPEHIEIAQRHLQLAEVEDRVELRQGVAKTVLEKMIENGEESFDLVFIDADKKNYPLYLDLILQLVKPGSVILGDNLIPKENEINDPSPNDPDAQGIYEYNRKISTDPRLESILITTIVGDRGRIDALGLSIVT